MGHRVLLYGCCDQVKLTEMEKMFSVLSNKGYIKSYLGLMWIGFIVGV